MMPVGQNLSVFWIFFPPCLVWFGLVDFRGVLRNFTLCLPYFHCFTKKLPWNIAPTLIFLAGLFPELHHPWSHCGWMSSDMTLQSILSCGDRWLETARPRLVTYHTSVRDHSENTFFGAQYHGKHRLHLPNLHISIILKCCLFASYS